MSAENIKQYVLFTQRNIMKTLQLMESGKMIMLELKDRRGGRDSVFCVASGYELDCPGFETRCVRDFRTHLVRSQSTLLCNV